MIAALRAVRRRHRRRRRGAARRSGAGQRHAGRGRALRSRPRATRLRSAAARPAPTCPTWPRWARCRCAWWRPSGSRRDSTTWPRSPRASPTTACRWSAAICRGADQLVVSIAALGRAERPVLRSGGRPGDLLVVTGRLGGQAASGYTRRGHAADRRGPVAGAGRVRHDRPLRRHRLATPRRLAEASGCGAVVELALLPRAAEGATVEQAAAGGEDFELLAAVDPPPAVPPVPVTVVGRLIGAPGVRLLDPDGVARRPARLGPLRVNPVVGGAIAALCWGLSTVVASRSTRIIGAQQVLAWVLLLGLVVVAPAGPARRARPPHATPSAWAWAVVAGLASNAGTAAAVRGASDRQGRRGRADRLDRGRDRRGALGGGARRAADRGDGARPDRDRVRGGDRDVPRQPRRPARARVAVRARPRRRCSASGWSRRPAAGADLGPYWTITGARRGRHRDASCCRCSCARRLPWPGPRAVDGHVLGARRDRRSSSPTCTARSTAWRSRRCWRPSTPRWRPSRSYLVFGERLSRRQLGGAGADPRRGRGARRGPALSRLS